MPDTDPTKLTREAAEALGRAELVELVLAQADLIHTLQVRVARLEAEVGANSENSSKPPASDPMGPRQSRAERRAAARQAGRKRGKQPGQPGSNLARRVPDTVVHHRPQTCGGCGADLAGAALVGSETRQVIDIPAVVAAATDHVVVKLACRCGVLNVGSFPSEATAPVCWGPEVRALALYLMDRQHLPVGRTAEALAQLLDAPVSTGWLCSLRLEAAGRLAGFMDGLRRSLSGTEVLCVDETGTRVGTTKGWFHTLVGDGDTLLVAHARRGREAWDDIGVLAGFGGVVMHDGFRSYDAMGAAIHAQCGAHFLRHLRSLGTEAPEYSGFTRDMVEVLLEAKAAAEEARARGSEAVAPARVAELTLAYRDVLAKGAALLPPGMPPRPDNKVATHRWSYNERRAYNLIRRLRVDQADVLRFLTDIRVPFDNNAAERSLRMVKLHDKISGTFRSWEAARAFATVRSYLQTAAAHGQNRLAVLRALFTGDPWMVPYRAGGT